MTTVVPALLGKADCVCLKTPGESWKKGMPSDGGHHPLCPEAIARRPIVREPTPRSKKMGAAPAARTIDRVFEHLLRKYTLARDLQTVQELNVAYGHILTDRARSDA